MGKSGTGGLVAAPIFRDFMQATIGDKPAIPFRIPPGLTMVRVNLHTGQPSNSPTGTVMEAFKSGTEPTGQEGPVLQGQPLSAQDMQPEGEDTGAPAPGTGSNIGSGTGGLY